MENNGLEKVSWWKVAIYILLLILSAGFILAIQVLKSEGIYIRLGFIGWIILFGVASFSYYNMKKIEFKRMGWKFFPVRKIEYKGDERADSFITKQKELKNNHFEQLVAIRKYYKKSIVIFIGFVVLVLVSIFIYSSYVTSQKNKQFCLQSINYLGTRYLIDDSKGNHIRKPNGNTAIFKTKNDAMEYCLTFLKTAKKKSLNFSKNTLSFSDKIRSTAQNDKN